jgi:hypothetical protein
MASKRRRNTRSKQAREECQFTVRGIRRNPPDIRKLSRALIDLAMAETERQAQAEQAVRQAQLANTPDGHGHLGGNGDASAR